MKEQFLFIPKTIGKSLWPYNDIMQISPLLRPQSEGRTTVGRTRVKDTYTSSDTTCYWSSPPGLLMKLLFLDRKGYPHTIKQTPYNRAESPWPRVNMIQLGIPDREGKCPLELEEIVLWKWKWYCDLLWCDGRSQHWLSADGPIYNLGNVPTIGCTGVKRQKVNLNVTWHLLPYSAFSLVDRSVSRTMRSHLARWTTSHSRI